MKKKSKRRFLAPVISLGAGSIASILMLVGQFEQRRMFGWLLLVLVLFYFLGGILSYMIGRFIEKNEAEAAALLAEEGEVIEKEAAEGAEISEEAAGDEGAKAVRQMVAGEEAVT